ncbi:unnamed protein product, partial [Prunus brigantina]
FIDDYSRKTWVYFLQEKSEALNAFKHFKAAAKNEIDKTIKVFRTDRGGEYNSKAFENFCAIHGVRQQLTAAYTPQQNGVAERKNHTILNMSIYILNRSPTFVVRDLTPEEAWSGRKPAIGYFKVFGCIAYARIPDEKRKKLDDKGEKCVFDSVSGSEGSDDDPLVHFALFADSDPVSFSDAVREPKW